MKPTSLTNTALLARIAAAVQAVIAKATGVA
jgi:hypothetical protein